MTHRHRRTTAWAALSALLMALTAPAAAAQDWPSRPVRVVVSSAAGSAPDIIARLITNELATIWGQGVVVDNRPGAGGNIGAQAAARSAPDGYTIWFAHATPVVMNQFLFKNPGFDADRDFAPIVRVGINPMILSVNPGVAAGTLGELLRKPQGGARALSFATSGSKNIPHLVGETLNQITGVGMVAVPYKGSQQAAADTIAGRTEVYIDAVPPMAPLIGAQPRLRPVAVFTEKRIPGFESIPTAREQGVDLVMQGWMAFLAPAGTPQAVIDKVNRDVNTVLARPAIVERLSTLGTFEPGGRTDELAAFIRQERSQWERVVQRSGIERD